MLLASGTLFWDPIHIFFPLKKYFEKIWQRSTSPSTSHCTRISLSVFFLANIFSSQIFCFVFERTLDKHDFLCFLSLLSLITRRWEKEKRIGKWRLRSRNKASSSYLSLSLSLKKVWSLQLKILHSVFVKVISETFDNPAL